MVGPVGGRSGATTNVQTSTNLYRRQQAPPTRRYLNDGATGTLAAPASVDARVDPTNPQISRESNKLGSSLSPREPMKRRTSRIHAGTAWNLVLGGGRKPGLLSSRQSLGSIPDGRSLYPAITRQRARRGFRSEDGQRTRKS